MHTVSRAHNAADVLHFLFCLRGSDRLVGNMGRRLRSVLRCLLRRFRRVAHDMSGRRSLDGSLDCAGKEASCQKVE